MTTRPVSRPLVILAPQVGLEPTTLRLTVACSTGWAIEEYLCWRLPIVPGRFQPSIVGTSELNFRVRDGNGWTLTVINTNLETKSLSFPLLLPQSAKGSFLCLAFRLVTRAGIEPTLTAWEAAVLTAWPTGHICQFRSRSLRPLFWLCGAPSGTRTRDTLIKSQVLYQLS